MRQITRTGLAGLLALALAGSAMAQTAPAAPAGAPTATEPAATETPKAPAAAGGDASDATASGQPAGSAPPTDASGTAPATGAAAEKTFPIPKAGDKANQVELITGLCGVQMKDMKPESCKCLAEQALTNLSDPQRDYLIATVVSPPVADRMLGDGRVGQPDQQVIASFIDKTTDACATGTFKPTK
ncbi:MULTISPECIES: hypothetical protein [unclassified Aureimonas]|uniref:hypothetical protein n=1 Tax=unclassified Aureimonas TaxID=2615206 RepID=UPI0006F5FAA2|nr:MULTISPECIES: hypothetical protein [unclassified Aureimonas]KQT66015.1 hypothetical protein ASG62_21120 [Aureimonas sp. Leaf427]KQT73373.1 hypothetical protein ASG54_17600 [Aureimonas sp. Leaf460]